MKTDFTATGKRTWKGALKDGYNGVKRFFLGNFYDNRDQVTNSLIQDFIDFSLARLKPKKNEKLRIRHPRFTMLYLLTIVLISIPFLVNYSVDEWNPPIEGSE